MSTLFFDTTAAYIPADNEVAALDKATNVSIQKTPGNSLLRNIVFRGVRYEDRGAACSCEDLELYKFSDVAYTRCAAHGTVEVGMLRRALERKAVRR